MRLPRKRKKQVKKLVAAKTAIKVALSAMTSAQAAAQVAIIGAIPGHGPTFLVEKVLRVAQVAADTSKAIGRIISEPPNSWKDFIKQS